MLVTAGAHSTPASNTPPQLDILSLGDIDTRITTGISHFGDGQGNTLDTLPAARFGLPGPIDIAFTAPYRYDTEADRSAMRAELEVEVAYGWRETEQQQGTIRAYSTLGPTSDGRDVGSGSHNLGIRADLRANDWAEAGAVYLRGALERIDHRDDPDRPTYRLANRLMLESGIGLDLEADAEPYFGIRGTQGFGPGRSSDQQSVAFRPGFRYGISPEQDLHVYAHFDALQRDAEPERALFATWTYRFRQPATDTQGLQRRIERLEEDVTSLNQRMAAVEQRTLARDPPRTTEEAADQILILNHSGISELTPLVIDAVEALDLSVSDAREEADVPRRDRTVIRYQENEAETARRIARALPGNQLIEQRDDLPDGARIVVLIGFDLE